MPNRKTRERQLAKLAARRAAERRRKQRQRIVAAVVAFALVIGVGAVAFVAIAGGDSDRAGRSPSGTSSASASPSASYVPGSGRQTGTVPPQPPSPKVACGGEVPPEAEKPKPQFDGPPPLEIDEGATYVATMKTSCGTIEIELLADKAPFTVNSFVFLAEHHFFDGQYFHRLDTSIDVVQGGDPTGTGTGGPGYTIPDELATDETYPPGTVAMANTGGPNTGGSQFFLITGPNGRNLDSNPTFTTFGRIVAGLDVAKRIQRLPIVDPAAAARGDLSGQRPKETVYIESVTIAIQTGEPSQSPSPEATKPSPGETEDEASPTPTEKSDKKNDKKNG